MDTAKGALTSKGAMTSKGALTSRMEQAQPGTVWIGEVSRVRLAMTRTATVRKATRPVRMARSVTVPGAGTGLDATEPNPRPKPRAQRLKAKRVHRRAALEALPADQHPLAEEILQGGVPGVRQTIFEMNQKAKAEGLPSIKADPLIVLAERMAPGLKAAEWHDRADAAWAGIHKIDLRDIRSVIVAADRAARTEETRTLADEHPSRIGSPGGN